MMHGCHKCKSASGWLLLIIGVLFLLNDFDIWHFWGLQWWTVMFLYAGFTGVAMSKCKECIEVRSKKR